MFNKKKILGLICARGGSKGIPRKNIRPLGGVPLIAWSIEVARRCSFIDRTIISTDDHEIAALSQDVGADVPFIRPSELAQDDSSEWLVWQHALKTLEQEESFRADYLIVLPPTSPFRSDQDIERGIESIQDPDTDIVISVTPSCRNPYFNMVELDPSGFADICKMAEKKISRRQDAPRVYDMTTVLYVAKTEFVLQANSIFDGRVKALMIPETRALDIDTEMDLKFAQFLISEGFIAQNADNI